MKLEDIVREFLSAVEPDRLGKVKTEIIASLRRNRFRVIAGSKPTSKTPTPSRRIVIKQDGTKVIKKLLVGTAIAGLISWWLPHQPEFYNSTTKRPKNIIETPISERLSSKHLFV